MIAEHLREEFSTLVQSHVPGLKVAGPKATGHVPWREDAHPSFSADLEKAVWYDHARKEGGGVKEFKARLGLNGTEKQQRAITAVYPYYDEHKNLLYEVVRYEPKSFAQRCPDLNGKWIHNLNGVRRVLYKLPSLPTAATVYIVEGEKDADRLWSLGLPATTNPQGAGKWREEYNESLRGKKIVILPDNDEPGEQHAQAVARSLLGNASAVKIVHLPGLPAKGDVSDWFDAGHTKDELTVLVTSTPILKPEDLASKKPRHSRPVLTRLSDVAPQKVHWLWPSRIPLGKVTILDGDPGLGKSLISADLTARVTTACAMPDDSLSDVSEPAGVVILSAEDDLSDTIRPRLDAAGADVSRVIHLTGITEGDGQRLPDLADLEAIRTAIQAVSAKLVIIDPLMAYLPGQTDSHRDQDVRRNLAPLAALAAETGVAVLVVRHLNKSGGKNPLYRGGGSIGIIGAARSGLLVAADPEDETGERRVLVSTKSNLAKASVALAYHVSITVENVAYIEWEGQSEHTATSLLAQPLEDEDRSALEEAKDFLRDVLNGGASPAKDVQKQADQAGISYATLRRAKTALKIITRKRDGFFGKKESQQWCWMLPTEDAQDPTEGAQTHEHERLQQSSEKNSRKFNGVPEDAQSFDNEHLQRTDEHLQSWEDEL